MRYSKETLQKMSNARKNAWSDPEKRKLYLEKMTTEEYKQKQRNALEKRGNPSKELEVKIKISNKLKGIKRSDEVKKLISIRTKICMNRDNVREKIKNRERLFGDKNPNWKGGISCEPYCDIWLDRHYKESIKKRDRYTCKCCGVTRMLSLKVFECDLGIHHIDYNKKNCIPPNLVTICRSCNSKANGNRNNWKEYYERRKNAEYSTFQSIYESKYR